MFKINMAWKKPKYNKNELNKVGRILKEEDSSEEELARATEILNNWRAVHSYPLHIFQMTLKNVSKRQYISGCRAIVKDVETAKKIYNDYYLKGNLKHKRVGKKDYITFPKKDGYRSLHLIYEYKSDKGKTDYNGLRVEVQIR